MSKKQVASVVICDIILPVKDWTAKSIAALRTAASMTQQQLADYLGVTRAHVGHLEANIRPAGPQTVRLLGVLEKLHAGKWKPVQPPKRRKAP